MVAQCTFNSHAACPAAGMPSECASGIVLFVGLQKKNFFFFYSKLKCVTNWFIVKHCGAAEMPCPVKSSSPDLRERVQ